ncbi:MAG: sugar transferase [Balneolales bacterium]|nr:sugar transferase [Balneolales bacterium]
MAELLTKKQISRSKDSGINSVSELDHFISRYADVDSPYTYRFNSSNPSNLDFVKSEMLLTVINYTRINEFRYINKFFERVNEELEQGGLYIGCVETKEMRKKRVINKVHPLLSYPFYTIDFIYKRILPKLPVIKKAYFAVTDGKNRVVSMTETLGRLVSCGFKVIDTHQDGYLTWFVAQKECEPKFDMDATYGAIVGLNRIGKDGKLIKVYKVRTMHPYSEYIQDFIFEKNDLKKGGKFDQDFRITNWGKLFRKLWIDELPMFYNLLKGDVKLVGVRPLSRQYFNLYPSEFQQLRTKYKPGLIPPFYHDLPESLDEIIESEKRYLESYDKAPLRTDFNYFVKSLYNIIFKKARSS